MAIACRSCEPSTAIEPKAAFHGIAPGESLVSTRPGNAFSLSAPGTAGGDFFYRAAIRVRGGYTRKAHRIRQAFEFWKVFKMSELSKLCLQVEVSKRHIACQLANEIEFMETTLDRLKDEIAEGGVLERFEQGKQNFMREAPALTAYNKTIAQYSKLYRQFTDLLPDGEPEGDDELDEWIKEQAASR